MKGDFGVKKYFVIALKFSNMCNNIMDADFAGLN
jgi:hypothetical protein